VEKKNMRLGKPQKHKISNAAIPVFKNSYGGDE
jgi:hypothetical protein